MQYLLCPKEWQCPNEHKTYGITYFLNTECHSHELTTAINLQWQNAVANHVCFKPLTRWEDVTFCLYQKPLKVNLIENMRHFPFHFRTSNRRALTITCAGEVLARAFVCAYQGQMELAHSQDLIINSLLTSLSGPHLPSYIKYPFGGRTIQRVPE